MKKKYTMLIKVLEYPHDYHFSENFTPYVIPVGTILDYLWPMSEDECSLCSDGRQMEIKRYPELFRIIGHHYTIDENCDKEKYFQLSNMTMKVGVK